MKRVPPSRTPEKRREAYERNRETTRRWEQARKETPEYARSILAREMGLPVGDVPAELATLRFQQIQLKRAVRDAQSERLYDVIRQEYLAGCTTYELAEKYGFDRARVSSILRHAGIKIKQRPHCKHGHGFTEANTYHASDGSRRCRKCACERTRRYEEKKRAPNV